MVNKKSIKQREILLKNIKDEVLNLKSSPLCVERIKNGTFAVIGEGSCVAKIMFVGEAPGRNEAKTGRPFCGSAGKILDELLKSIDLKREDIYITNIVKDRPPQNRDPLPSEIESYGPFLDKQIEIIQPTVIATLGRYSMVYVMKKFGLDEQLKSISESHGKWYEAKASYDNVIIIALYHPATAIYNQSLKGTLKKDFKIIKKYARE